MIHKDNTTTEADRGQVGIGTLIVFIALVLVAAIAAGVLINTAGFLQTQAEATGEESTSQVSDSVQVLSASGEVVGSEIEVVDLRVSLAPGADRLDMTGATVEWVGNNDAATMPITQSDNDRSAIFSSPGDESADVVIPNDESTQLSDSDERTSVLIVGEGSAFSDDIPMGAGDEADLTITTASGGQAHVSLRVPDILEDGEGVNL